MDKRHVKTKRKTREVIVNDGRNSNNNIIIIITCGLNVRWLCRVVGRSAARGKACAPLSFVLARCRHNRRCFPDRHARDSQWTVRRWSLRRCVARNHYLYTNTRDIDNDQSWYQPKTVQTVF